MNRLSTERRAQVIGLLCEGMSMRAVSRTTGVARQTVSDLLENIGQACSEYQDAVLRNLPCEVVECDEIWSFVGSKARNVPEDKGDDPNYGDVWTWTAIDSDTKLVPSWLVGERSLADCYTFLADLKPRLKNNRIQLTTDGLSHYATVADALWRNSVDFAQLVKIYGPLGSESPEQRYSPGACTGTDIRIMAGNPDPGRISTSYVERQNLSMRMGMRRFTRLTNAFSKKVEFHAHAVSLYRTALGFLEAPFFGKDGVMPAPRKFPAELRERAVRLVFETREQSGEKRGCWTDQVHASKATDG